LVEQLQASVVFVHYSLSPEVKYPVALEECYTALCWIQDNANAIHVDIKRLAVCGDSAGGNLAAALSSKLAIFFFHEHNTNIIIMDI
jgi:acetyl esterase